MILKLWLGAAEWWVIFISLNPLQGKSLDSFHSSWLNSTRNKSFKPHGSISKWCCYLYSSKSIPFFLLFLFDQWPPPPCVQMCVWPGIKFCVSRVLSQSTQLPNKISLITFTRYLRLLLVIHSKESGCQAFLAPWLYLLWTPIKFSYLYISFRTGYIDHKAAKL